MLLSRRIGRARERGDGRLGPQEEGETVLPGTMLPQSGAAPEASWNVEPEYLVNQ
jgi:hypothetical protein